jgi:MFS family permease
MGIRVDLISLAFKACGTNVCDISLAVGVFHQYWGTVLFPDEAAATQLTVAATLQTGLTWAITYRLDVYLLRSNAWFHRYAVTIVVGPLCSRYREYRVILQYTGLLLAVLGILLSGFASKPWHLIVTAGIIYPIGATVLWMPIATLTFEWFAARRGLATGILYAGTGLGGAVFPIVMQTLLDKYSYKAASISLVSIVVSLKLMSC